MSQLQTDHSAVRPERDLLGGFRSLDEVEQIEGIPYDTLLDLNSRSAV